MKSYTDANEWLIAGATAEDCITLLATAPTWVEVLATEAGQANNGRRPALMRQAFRQVTRLEEVELALMRQNLAQAMGLNLRDFDRMLKAVRGELEEEATEGEGGPLFAREVVGGPIPTGEGEYTLVETIYQPPGNIGATAIGMGHTRFAARLPDGTIQELPHVDTDETCFTPPMPMRDLVQKGTIKFAPAISELLSTRELLDRIQAIIHKYVDMSEFFEKLSGYYILLTWLYDAFDVIPYLRFRGDYGTGKSRALQVVGHLCFRPMSSSGATSEAALFRTMSAYKPTTLLDEADYQNSDYAALIVKILNLGYDRRQAYIIRCADKSKEFEPEANECFGPKIIAMRGKFEDEALNSRFFTEEMKESVRDDIPKNLPRSFWEEEMPEMQSLLLRWRLEHWKPYIEPTSDDVLDVAVSARLAQISTPLLTMVEEDDIRQIIREFLLDYNRRLIEQRGLELAAKVLEALVLQQYIEENEERKAQVDWDLSVQTLAALTNQLMDYDNYGQDGYIENRLNPKRDQVGSRKIGHQLRTQLQLQATRRSQFGGRFVVEWDPDRIAALRRRYGITEDRFADLLEIYFAIQMLEEKMRDEDLRKQERQGTLDL